MERNGKVNIKTSHSNRALYLHLQVEPTRGSHERLVWPLYGSFGFIFGITKTMK
jgi:hypothetical protein